MFEPLDPHRLRSATAQSANKKRILLRSMHQNSLFPFVIMKDEQHRRISIYRQINPGARCGHRLLFCGFEHFQTGKIFKIRGSKMQLKIHLRSQLRGGAKNCAPPRED